MDIIGSGMDATEIDRVADTIARYGERFLRRIYTAGEIAYCRARKNGTRPSRHDSPPRKRP